MKYQLAIFDFDGTLADTFPWFLSIMDDVADKFGFDRIDRSQVEHLRGQGARQMLEQYRIPPWKMALAANYVRGRMQQDAAKIALFPGIERTLPALAQRGVRLALVSSNALDNVRQVLGPRLAPLFGDYECGISAFGKGSKLKKVLARSRVAPGAAIYTGDELRDLDAARQAGLAFGAVAWGYTRPDALQAARPDRFFQDVDDLITQLAAA